MDKFIVLDLLLHLRKEDHCKSYKISSTKIGREAILEQFFFFVGYLRSVSRSLFFQGVNCSYFTFELSFYLLEVHTNEVVSHCCRNSMCVVNVESRVRKSRILFMEVWPREGKTGHEMTNAQFQRLPFFHGQIMTFAMLTNYR